MAFLEIDFPSRVTVTMCTENSDPICFDFIWGVGKEGLTDFELALSRAPKGKSVPIAFGPATVQAVFGHLASLVMPLCGSDTEIRATAQIEKIEPVSNREVVKAIASLNEDSCGCGGGDGCGCQ